MLKYIERTTLQGGDTIEDYLSVILENIQDKDSNYIGSENIKVHKVVIYNDLDEVVYEIDYEVLTK